MHYCLNREELAQYMESRHNALCVCSDELQVLIENATSWQDEVGILTYLFSMVLEQKAKNGESCHHLIEVLYQLQDQLFLHVQECDFVFVDSMLRVIRDSKWSIEEELVAVQNRLGNHEHVQSFRY